MDAPSPGDFVCSVLSILTCERFFGRVGSQIVGYRSARALMDEALIVSFWWIFLGRYGT